MRLLIIAQNSSQNLTREIFKSVLKAYQDSSDYSNIYYLASTGLQNFFSRIIFSHLIKKQAFIPPRFFTIKELAITLLERKGILKKNKIIPNFLKPLIIFSLAENDQEKERLTFGYAVILAEFITELKQYPHKNLAQLFRDRLSIYPQVLANLEFALNIKERYQKYLSGRDLFDEEDAQYQAIKLLEKESFSFPYLLLDGFIDFTFLEKEFIKALLNKSEKVVAGVVRETDGSSLSSCFEDFLRSNKDWQEIFLKSSIEKRKNLPFFGYPSIEDELEGIVKRIKLRHINGEKSLDQVLITAPALKKYRFILERVLKRFELPFNIFPEYKLKDLPPFAFIIGMLKAIEDNYPRLQTALIFASPYFSNFSPATKQYAGFLSRAAGLLSGKSEWLNLSSTLREIVKGDEALLNLQKRGVIKKVTNEIKNFLDQTESLRNGKRLGEFVEKFRTLLNNLGFLSKNEDDLIFEAQLRLNEILAWLEEFDTEMNYTQFVKVIDHFFHHTRVSEPKNLKGIKVVDLHDLITWDLSWLNEAEIYAFALQEPELPSYYRPEPLIPDFLKKELGLPNLDTHLAREKIHFNRLLFATSSPPYLSFHFFEDEKPILPSPFLEDERKKPEPIRELLIKEEFQELVGQKLNLVQRSLFSFEELDGKAQELLPFFANWATEKNPLSVTQLTKFLRCPYLFYLEEVLNLALEEEKKIEIELWRWGNLVHKIMESIYKEKVAEIWQLPELIKLVAQRIIQEDFSGFLPIWKDFANRIFEKIIPTISEQEKKLRNSGYLPWKFEVKIKGEILKGIWLKGRIDRIDKRHDKVFIIDYKTGREKPLTIKSLKNDFDNIQLFIYYLLWNQKETEKCERVGIYYLPNIKLKEFPNKEEEGFDEVSEYVKDVIKNSVARIRIGNFRPVDVKEGVCFYCDYYSFCPKRD